MDFKEYNMKEFEDIKYAERILIQRADRDRPLFSSRGSKTTTRKSVYFKWSRLRTYARLRTMFKRKWFEMN